MNEPILSIVIPAHNEQDVLMGCVSRINNIIHKLAIPYEMIFIDDGSNDHSVKILLNLRKNSPNIKIIRLSRNFGKEVTLTARLESSHLKNRRDCNRNRRSC